MFLTLLFCLLAAPAEGPRDSGFLRLHRAPDRGLMEGELEFATECFLACLEIESRQANIAYGLACAAAKGGTKAEAIKWLADAAEWGYPDAELALWDSDLASIRNEEGFERSIASMRENAYEAQVEVLTTEDDPVEEPSFRWVGPTFVGPTSANIFSKQPGIGRITEVEVVDRKKWVIQGDDLGFITVLDQLTGKVLSRSERLDSEVWELAVDPTGKYVFALTWRGILHRWELDGFKDRVSWMVLPGARSQTGKFGWPYGAFLEFDPTGKRLLVAAGAHGAALLQATGEPIKKWNTSFGGSKGVLMNWSFDGKLFAGINDGVLRLFTGESGEEVPMTYCASNSDTAVAFGPKGKLIATGLEGGGLRVWDMETQAMLYESFCEDPFGPDPVRVIRFSPSGNRIAFSTAESVYVQVVDSRNGDVLYYSDFLGGRKGETAEMSWSPDSRSLWHSYDSGACALFHVSLRGPLMRRVVTEARPPYITPSGIAAFTSGYATSLAQADSGFVFWRRPIQAEQSDLIYAPSGHFSGNLRNLDSFWYGSTLAGNERVKLTNLATKLFDPKRVRASQAGVPVLAAQLNL